MAFTKLENEEAVEALADMLEPAATICADQKIQAMVKNSKPPILIASEIMKAYPEQIVAIMAASEGRTIKEYKVSIPGIIKKLIDLLNDKEFMSFFTSQAQTTEQILSGKPTESTEEKEQ